MKIPGPIMLGIVLVVSQVPPGICQSGSQIEVRQSVIAGGGGEHFGGTFTLAGTAGQSTAGTTSSGGIFSVSGGFWTAGAVGTPTPEPTTFVIGDRNALVGNKVTFWGAQWARVNSLTFGPAPSRFRGYANSTTPTTPVCGGHWSTAPGNSSDPPEAVPEYITVLVANSITNAGSRIQGNIVAMALIRTDPGYGPAPGATGTGTIVSLVCVNGAAAVGSAPFPRKSNVGRLYSEGPASQDRQRSHPWPLTVFYWLKIV